MTQWMQKLVIAMLLGSSSLLAACNTMEGAGKDIERGGQEVQDAAKPGDQR
jgi:entericidin B